MTEILMLLLGVLLGGGGLFAFTHFSGRNALARARQEAERLRENARQEAANKAKEIELTARQQQLKLKEQFER
jgi:hypothetical protein